MLFQTKLFSPPPTTPEAEMQQKTMKFMMIFMAAMFYKVPSGLGLYFITSSLWSIGERLLLPKVISCDPAQKAGTRSRRAEGHAAARAAPAARADRRQRPCPAEEAPSAFGQFWEKVLEDARKNPTYRKMLEDRDEKEDKSSSDERPRSRSRQAPGPAGKEMRGRSHEACLRIVIRANQGPGSHPDAPAGRLGPGRSEGKPSSVQASAPSRARSPSRAELSDEVADRHAHERSQASGIGGRTMSTVAIALQEAETERKRALRELESGVGTILLLTSFVRERSAVTSCWTGLT